MLISMDTVVQVKLKPSREQAKRLLETLETTNQAANYLACLAFSRKIFSRVPLQRVGYRDVRDRFPVSAQITCLVIRKVSDAYRIDKKVLRIFRPRGSIAYDTRILSWNQKNQMVSIWVVGIGRTLIPYQAGPLQLEKLKHQQGETKLIFRGGCWYLNATVKTKEPEIENVEGFLGVDLGVANIAVTSDHQRVTSEVVERNRAWYHRRRQVLQSVGTKSAKRRLKQLAGRQKRFQRDVNHRISKELITVAKRTHRGIAMEDLHGIRSRTRVKKANRDQRNNWSFFQLRFFVEYKSRAAGVLLILVNPAYTSQRCSRCGNIDKRNRRSQSVFHCMACGYETNADYNSAQNIRDLGSKGYSQQPHGSDLRVSYKPLALARGS